MSLDITGKIVKISPQTSGDGKFGKWQKQEFVIETKEQYPKKVCFTVFNDKLDELQKFKENDEVTVSFNPESREYNQKWYTDLRAWKITLGTTSGGSTGSSKTETPPPFTEADIPPADEEDLPF